MNDSIEPFRIHKRSAQALETRPHTLPPIPSRIIKPFSLTSIRLDPHAPLPSLMELFLLSSQWMATLIFRRCRGLLVAALTLFVTFEQLFSHENFNVNIEIGERRLLLPYDILTVTRVKGSPRQVWLPTSGLTWSGSERRNSLWSLVWDKDGWHVA